MPVQSVYLGAFTGSDETELPVFSPDQPIVVTGVKITDITGVTANASNYGTATLYNRGTAGAGTTSVAARATDTVTTDDITAKVPWALVLSTTAADLEVAEDEALAFKWTEAGTGQDLGGALVEIEFEWGTGKGYAA